MRVSELLRVMAGMLDAAEQSAQPAGQAPVVVNVITKGEQPSAEPSAPADDTATGNPGVFVPPLQQKIELLKKSVGMDSVFDHSEEDEIQKLRRAAGIKNTLAQQEAADDEPLDV